MTYIYIYISPTINSYNKTQMENENLILEAYIHGKNLYFKGNPILDKTRGLIEQANFHQWMKP
jgi:hypothetical protein